MNTNNIKSLEIRKMNMLNSLVSLQDKNKITETSLFKEKKKIDQSKKEIKLEKTNLIKIIISTILISLSIILVGFISLFAFTSTITELLLFSLIIIGMDSLLIYDQVEKHKKRTSNLNNKILVSKVKIAILNQKEEKFQTLIQDCQQLLCKINKEIKEEKKKNKHHNHHDKILTTNICESVKNSV